MDILDQIRGELADVVIYSVDIEAATPETTLESLGIDSLDRIELVMKIEERFEIEISHEEAKACATVGDILKLVDSKLDHTARDRVNKVNEVAVVLWGAYSRGVGGVAFNGDPLPDWATFAGDPAKKTQSEAWLLAAGAVLDHLQKA
jgi:acyl carrier protein